MYVLGPLFGLNAIVFLATGKAVRGMACLFLAMFSGIPGAILGAVAVLWGIPSYFMSEWRDEPR